MAKALNPINASTSVVCFSTLSPEVRILWAKSGDGAGHGLLAHLLDVAAVAETLLALEPPSCLDWAAAVFGLPRLHCCRWLAALVGLHDYGKAIGGFQAKWPEGKQADIAYGLDFAAHACKVTDHSCATAALLRAPLHQASKAEILWLKHAIQAVSAHHGYHFVASEVNRAHPSGESDIWKQARQSLLDIYWQVLAPQGVPDLDELSLPAVNWLAGLTSAADWIASNPQWFPLGERCDDLREYYENAQQLAHAALQHIGWRPWQPLLRETLSTAQTLSQIVGRQNIQPRALQHTGDALLQSAQGPALLLVEAPMGEGKTELAFLAHLRLQLKNGHRGLYLALPTQATGNVLFTRALRFLENFASSTLDVQLIHGGAMMNEAVIRLRGINGERDNSQALSVSSWFSQRRRPLLSPYGVGTVDQALFSTLNVKHHFVRLWGLANRVIVLDEVHAYDTYTSGLIEALLRWLKALGSSVILMSATLPQKQRDRLLQAWDVNPQQIPDLSYPRIVLADHDGVRGEHFPARPLPEIHLHGLGETIENLADNTVELLNDGGCGTVIVNTVDRAQQLYTLLRKRLDAAVPIVLFHARFPMQQRIEIEARVLSLFGVQGKRPQQALLIATQVAEQSLDIDFDFMLSDLAPVDLLLQRAGRLHRHQRTRPQAHAQACFWVAGLTSEFPDLKTTAWGFIYDAYILGRTWALLGQETQLQLPDDIDRLVQAVYGDDPLPEERNAELAQQMETQWYGEYRAKVNQERQQAQNIAIDPEAEAHAAYDSKPRGGDEDDLTGQRNATRLGSNSITVIPVDVVDTGWKIDGHVFQPEKPINDMLAKLLYAHQLRLSRKDIVKHFSGESIPTAFAEHPLLKNMHPLPLSQGQYRINDGLTLKLDDELGLLYLPRQPNENLT